MNEREVSKILTIRLIFHLQRERGHPWVFRAFDFNRRFLNLDPSLDVEVTEQHGEEFLNDWISAFQVHQVSTLRQCCNSCRLRWKHLLHRDLFRRPYSGDLLINGDIFPVLDPFHKSLLQGTYFFLFKGDNFHESLMCQVAILVTWIADDCTKLVRIFVYRKLKRQFFHCFYFRSDFIRHPTPYETSVAGVIEKDNSYGSSIEIFHWSRCCSIENLV